MGSEEQLIGWVVRFLPVGVTQIVQVLAEIATVWQGNLNASQHTPVVGTVVTIVEQADIPPLANGLQKTQ